MGLYQMERAAFAEKKLQLDDGLAWLAEAISRLEEERAEWTKTRAESAEFLAALATDLQRQRQQQEAMLSRRLSELEAREAKLAMDVKAHNERVARFEKLRAA